MNSLFGGFFGTVEDGSREKAVREKKQGRYQQNLALYNKSLVDKDDTALQYRQIVTPFQLVVETDSSDFSQGISEGMVAAKKKMTLAIVNFMSAQLAAKEWPIESFTGADNKLCFGMTAYLLTDDEMKTLEEVLK